MKKNLCLSLVVGAMALALLSCKKNVQPVEVQPEGVKKTSLVNSGQRQTNLRVVAYLYVSDLNKWNQYTDSADLDQYSHVIYSFVNPKVGTTLSLSSDVVNQSVVNAVTKCHNKNIETSFAIGGGGATATWDQLIAPAQRAETITQLRKLATTYNFDGIDVDLEGSRITADYNDFIIQLSDTLRQYSKKLSIALGKWQGELVSAAAYSRLDYLNAMIYDFQKTTAQSAAGYVDFQAHVQYFKTKVPISKLNAGVPFYASKYEGNAWLGKTVPYNTILKTYPNQYSLNYVYATPTESWWYDGQPLLMQKVAYCRQQSVGGMMVWHALFDTKDDKTSLFKLINYCAANPSGFNPADNYTFTNWGNDKAMFVQGGGNGALVVQKAADPNTTKWSIELQGSGNFAIKNTGFDRFLQITGSSTADGAGVAQGSFTGGNEQQFKLVPDTKGYYSVTNVNSNKPIQTNGTLDSTQLTQSTSSSTNNQKWQLIKQ